MNWAWKVKGPGPGLLGLEIESGPDTFESMLHFDENSIQFFSLIFIEIFISVFLNYFYGF